MSRLPPIPATDWDAYKAKQFRTRALRQIAEGLPDLPEAPPPYTGPTTPKAPEVPQTPAPTSPPAATPPTAARAPLAGDLVPNQFASGLDTATAYAACGPVAAIAFARRVGRNPTAQEAVDLAKQVGWTAQQGMAGAASEKALLDKMGVPSRLENGVDWAKVRADVEGGNPVIIDTPGHYFVATGFNPDTGQFDFQASGTALKAGSRWMTPEQLNKVGMGQARSALYLDNPEPNTAPSIATLPDRGGAGVVEPIPNAQLPGGGHTVEPIPNVQLPAGFDPTKDKPPNFEAAAAYVADRARAQGLGDEGAKAAVAVLRTEGGWQGATNFGDAARTGSAQGTSEGGFQLNFKPGNPGTRYARSMGISDEEARNQLRTAPLAATDYWLSEQGDLGNAIRAGMAKGLTGSALATYAQANGQRSIHPETAGGNYDALFGAGQPLPAPTAGPAAGPSAPTIPPPPERPSPSTWMDRAQAAADSLEAGYGGLIAKPNIPQPGAQPQRDFVGMAQAQVDASFGTRAQPATPVSSVPLYQPSPRPVTPLAPVTGEPPTAAPAQPPAPLPMTDNPRGADYYGTPAEQPAPVAPPPPPPEPPQPAPPPEPQPLYGQGSISAAPEPNPLQRAASAVGGAFNAIPGAVASAAPALAEGYWNTIGPGRFSRENYPNLTDEEFGQTMAMQTALGTAGGQSLSAAAPEAAAIARTVATEARSPAERLGNALLDAVRGIVRPAEEAAPAVERAAPVISDVAPDVAQAVERAAPAAPVAEPPISAAPPPAAEALPATEPALTPFDRWWIEKSRTGLSREVPEKVAGLQSEIDRLTAGVAADPANPGNAIIHSRIAGLQQQVGEQTARLTEEIHPPSEWMSPAQLDWHSARMAEETSAAPTREAFEQAVAPLTRMTEPSHAVTVPLPDVPIPTLRTPRPEPVPPSPNPGSPGAAALDTILTEPVGPPNPNGAARLTSFVQSTIRQTFDDRIDLKLAQRNVERAYGGDLPPALRAVELDRMTGGTDMAARVRVERELETAYARAGKDTPALKAYLEAQDNIDKAASIGQKVGAEVLRQDIKPHPNEARLNGMRLSLDAAARRGDDVAMNRIQRQIDRAEKQISDYRDEALRQRASEGVFKAAVAEQGRQFSGGLDAASSRAALEDLRARLGPEQFSAVEDAANGVYQYVDRLRQRMVDSGVWSKELADTLRAQYPHYIPTNILDYMDDAAPRFASGQKLGLSDQGLKRLTVEGTTREREDVTAALTRMAFEVERRARKNEAAQAVYNWRQIDPDLGKLMRDVTPGAKHTKNEVPLYFFENGAKKEVLVDRAFEPVISFQAVGSQNAAARVASFAANVVRVTATGRNPLFALAGNPLLDLPTYLWRESAQYGVHRLPQIATELARGYADTLKGLSSGEIAGSGFQRFLAGGGGQFGYFGGSQAEVKQLASQVERRALGRVINSQADLAGVLKDAVTFGWVEKAGFRTENAPRVAAMRLAERYGADQQASIMAGRTVTQDFTQGGLFTKALNQFIPFFNIATQTPYWLAQTMKNNPKGAIAGAAALVVAPTVAAEAWNRGDAERARAYDDVPDFVKNRGVVVMHPDPWLPPDKDGRTRPNYFLLPMRNLAPFHLMARAATERAMGDATPQMWQDTLKALVGASSPVGTESAEGAVGTFLPAIFSPVLQLAVNRDFFRNRAVVSDIADEQATRGSQHIAEGLRGVGFKDVRPSAVEFVLREAGNGIAGMALAGIDLGDKLRNGEPATPPNPALRDLPVVGGLIGRFMPSAGGQKDADLKSLRDNLRDGLIEERRRQIPNYDQLPDATQKKIEAEAGDVATKLAYGTDRQPNAIISQLRDALKVAGHDPKEIAERISDLRKQLSGASEQVAPQREQTRQRLRV